MFLTCPEINNMFVHGIKKINIKTINYEGIEIFYFCFVIVV